MYIHWVTCWHRVWCYCITPQWASLLFCFSVSGMRILHTTQINVESLHNLIFVFYPFYIIHSFIITLMEYSWKVTKNMSFYVHKALMCYQQYVKVHWVNERRKFAATGLDDTPYLWAMYLSKSLYTNVVKNTPARGFHQCTWPKIWIKQIVSWERAGSKQLPHAKT